MRRAFAVVVTIMGWAMSSGTAAAADALGKCPTPTPYAPETPVKWSALSATARAVTGEIAFSKTGVTFENGARAQLKYVGERQLLSYMGLGQISCASFYAIEPAFSDVLLRESFLCGAPDVPAVALAISPPTPAGETALYIFRRGDDVEGLPGGRLSFCGSFYFKKN